MAGDVFVLGVRHHGPGSARAVGAALAEIQPDAVLIEGAPELDKVADLARHRDMVPPVAGLVYATEEPGRAVFYPMARFSPEWVALTWSLEMGVPVRFCDLPAAHALARRERPSGTGSRLRDDPIGALAAAAGYDDPERWWEDVIEHRHHGVGLFEAVIEAMGSVRTADLTGDEGAEEDIDEYNERREAFMRKVIRATLSGGASRVAVICGAWHAPALVPGTLPSVKEDTARLRGLPKLKVTATWVPWTSALLTRQSGYGAGVDSPGWYQELAADHPATGPGGAHQPAPTRFLVRAARLLRDRGHDVSPAATVEAVRLAEGLATLRGRPGPGLGEVLDAAQAALAGGSSVPLRLVSPVLLVGEDIGSVPDETPMVPLARDLAAQQRRLRLPAEARLRMLELDLRNETHRRRSQLLHRLHLLGIDWGEPAETGRTTGTFKEAWALQWHPSYSVALVEASGLGTTIESAATAQLSARAGATADPGELAGLVEESLLAELPGALAAVTDTLAARAAEQRDSLRLMAAVEPLARTRRYGNVRRVDTAAIVPVLSGLVTRVAIGLPAAVSALDDDGAARTRKLLDSADRAVGLLADDAAFGAGGGLRRPWLDALRAVAGQRLVHGLIAGRAVRVLLESGEIDAGEARRRLSLALSLADDAPQGAAWLEGFLAGDASLLLHDPELLGVVDDWVADVRGATFDELLPVLRRTFVTFAPPDRRALGHHLQRLRHGGPAGGTGAAEDLDPERADRVLPRLYELLGLDAGVRGPR